MATMILQRTIQAPAHDVFQSVAHIQDFQKVIPDIINVQFVSEQTSGVGTRFRETRLMGKREATTELEVTEYVKNERVRLIADAGGTLWDTVFDFKSQGDETHLTMTMESRPYKLLAKIFNPLIGPMIKGAVGKDMDAIKRYCEAAS